jgi:hypothetical protein
LTAESVAYKGWTYLEKRIIDVMKKRMVEWTSLKKRTDDGLKDG